VWQTRNQVIYLWAGWTLPRGRGRPEPVDVAISWDDLWIGVICQPNLEIAGSPRKVYRDRAGRGVIGGRATGWIREGNQLYSTKLRIPMYAIPVDSPHRAKLMWLKGNIPDSRLRSLSFRRFFCGGDCEFLAFAAAKFERKFSSSDS